MMSYFLKLFLAICSVGLSGCCAFKGAGCSNFQSSPSVSWVNTDGLPIPLSKGSLRIDSVHNITIGNDEVNYEVVGTYTQNSDVDNPDGSILRIFGAGEYGNLFETGGTRMNEVLIYYRYRDSHYADTMRYESSLEEVQCCSQGVMGPVLEYTGQLVQSFESQTDYPGIIVTLGE